MRLNHIDLHVPDVAATSDFLVNVFGLAELARPSDALRILHDDAGLEIVISRPNPKLGGADAAAAGVFTYHIGFVLPSRDEVDTQYRKVCKTVETPPRAPGPMRGGYAFYCEAPGRILVEVGCRS
jgi:catechol 2,3-dioxygenase-like lactoylglutathione lyase family enzyme